MKTYNFLNFRIIKITSKFTNMTSNRLKYKDIAIKYFLFSKIYPDISLNLVIPLIGLLILCRMRTNIVFGAMRIIYGRNKINLYLIIIDILIAYTNSSAGLWYKNKIEYLKKVKVCRMYHHRLTEINAIVILLTLNTELRNHQIGRTKSRL